MKQLPEGLFSPNSVYGFSILKKIRGFIGFFRIFFPEFFWVYEDFMNKKGLKY